MNGNGVVKMAAAPLGANTQFSPNSVKREKLEHRVTVMTFQSFRVGRISVAHPPGRAPGWVDAPRRSTPLTASLTLLLSIVPYFAGCGHTLSMGLPFARHSTNNHSVPTKP